MSDVRNLGNAAVILGCLYFLINGDFGFWATSGIILILIFAMGTWGIHTNPYDDQNKRLLEAKIKKTEAESRNILSGGRNLDSVTAFNAANAIFMRERARFMREQNNK
jgi:hypothetical protein